MRSIITVDSSQFDQLIGEIELLCDKRNPEALELINIAEQFALASGNIREVVMADYVRALFNCFVANNFDEAIRLINEALAMADEEVYAEWGYILLATLGHAYHLKGDFFSAQESYYKCLRTLEVIPQLIAKQKKVLAGLYYNLSVLLGSSKITIEIEGYFQKAIEIFKEQNLSFKLSMCYLGYAQMLERKGELRKAIEYLKLSLNLGDEMQDEYSVALSKANLCILSVKVNEYEQTENYITEALQYFQANSKQLEVGLIQFELGQAFVYIGEIEKGLAHITTGEKILTYLDNKTHLTELYRVKSKALVSTNHHQEANQYLEKYIESLKGYFDNEKTNALTRAKKEFELEQQKKEAKLLREKNAEIQAYVHKLEISNNELNQFAHVASHDLREPLRMITSYMNLLQKSMSGKLDEQQAEFFGFVVDGATRMDQLIQGLLRLAKVDANPIIEPVKLNNVINEIKLNLDTLLKEKKAEINISTLPVIFADRSQMIQLLQNLIANGLKYNDSEVPEIRINFLNRAEHIEIHVADNGIGIPKHLTEEVFKIFRRLNKHHSPGSGIGLSICKKIVERMNGSIKIEERTSGGTIFRIKFPKSVLVPVE